MLTPILTDILLFVLLLLSIWIAYRITAKKQQDETSTRIEVLFEEHLKRINNIEERIRQLQLDQQQAAAQLRERLIGSFSELREELRSILSE